MCRSGSLTSARTRSAAATPPGSRSSSAPGSAWARPVASVVLPAPSRPSMVTSGIGAEPYDAHLMLPGLERHPHARAVLRLDAPSHAYLFHGPAGAGKREVARAFAAELLADGAADPSSARARALRGAHPDLTWVAPSGAAGPRRRREGARPRARHGPGAARGRRALRPGVPGRRPRRPAVEGAARGRPARWRTGRAGDRGARGGRARGDRDAGQAARRAR